MMGGGSGLGGKPAIDPATQVPAVSVSVSVCVSGTVSRSALKHARVLIEAVCALGDTLTLTPHSTQAKLGLKDASDPFSFI